MTGSDVRTCMEISSCDVYAASNNRCPAARPRCDIIAIDAAAGTIDLKVDEAVLAERRKNWKPRRNDYQAGALWRYAQNVGAARRGAVPMALR